MQTSSTTSNSVFTESLLCDEELDKTFDVRGFPFEVTVWVVGWSDIRVEEELAGVGVGPVFWDLKLSLSCFDGFDEFLECAIFAD